MSDSLNSGKGQLKPGAVTTTDPEPPKHGLRSGSHIRARQGALPYSKNQGARPAIGAVHRGLHRTPEEFEAKAAAMVGPPEITHLYLPQKGCDQDHHPNHEEDEEIEVQPVVSTACLSHTDRGLRRTLEAYRAKVDANTARDQHQIHQVRGLRKNAPDHEHTHSNLFADSTILTAPTVSTMVSTVSSRGMLHFEPTPNEELNTDVESPSASATNRNGEEPHPPNANEEILRNRESESTSSTNTGAPVHPNLRKESASVPALLLVSTSSLAKATPVVDDVEIQDLPQAQQVDVEAQQQHKSHEQYRRTRNTMLGIALTILVIGILAAVWYILLQEKHDRPPASVAHATFSPETSTAPSYWPSYTFPYLPFSELPSNTQQSIVRVGTPQYHAWQWLQQYAHTIGADFDDTTKYPLQRKIELFALATFYYAFEGPNWPDLVRKDWLILDAGRHECTWFNSNFNWLDLGTGSYMEDEFRHMQQCNEKNYTETLFLAQLELANCTPTIPAEISLLASLKYLLLFDNEIFSSLTGLVPTELYLMSTLTHFNLDSNALTGTLPTELGLMSNLSQFFIFDNALTGSLPTQLGLMSNLMALSVFNNVLTGNLPSELGLLSNMGDLQLSMVLAPNRYDEVGGLYSIDTYIGNAFKGPLPTELGLLSNLYSLHLDGSTLTGTLPTELGLMSRLIVFSIAGNCLTGTMPTELGQLTDLAYLFLGSSLLTGTLPTELGLMNNLTEVDLSNLPSLTGTIPTELEDCFYLSYFNMSGSSNLFGTIPDHFCTLQNDFCVHFDLWGDFPCILDFDCSDTLCGCNCDCSNSTLS